MTVLKELERNQEAVILYQEEAESKKTLEKVSNEEKMLSLPAVSFDELIFDTNNDCATSCLLSFSSSFPSLLNLKVSKSGSSGSVRKASWKGVQVAVKMFHRVAISPPLPLFLSLLLSFCLSLPLPLSLFSPLFLTFFIFHS